MDSSPDPPHRARRRVSGRARATPAQGLLRADARCPEGSGGGAPTSLYREADHSCVFEMTRWQRRAHTGAIVRFPSTIGPAEPTARLRATVSERLGDSSVATTAKIYAHALRGKDRAAAQVWDDLMQQSRGEVSKGVN